MPIHFTFWIGGPTIRIVDMTNAGKRGKTCRELTATADYNSPAAECLRFAPEDILGEFGAKRLDRGGMFVGALDFDELAGEFEQFRTLQKGARVEIREIRGVDAPRRQLVAGDGKTWSASADEGGIRIADLSDAMNEPRVITTDQKKSAAYERAARVWSKVEQAAGFSEAWSVLSAAGCKLHYFCAVD